MGFRRRWEKNESNTLVEIVRKTQKKKHWLVVVGQG